MTRHLWRAIALAAGLALAIPAMAAIPASVSQQPPANDQANAVISGQFTTTGQSGSFLVFGSFNIFIYGASGPQGNWNGTVRLERSFDGGTTWVIAGVGGGGAQAIYNTPNQDVSIVATEVEQGMLYRLNCTVFNSGPIKYRLSTTGGTATTFIPP